MHLEDDDSVQTKGDVAGNLGPTRTRARCDPGPVGGRQQPRHVECTEVPPAEVRGEAQDPDEILVRCHEKSSQMIWNPVSHKRCCKNQRHVLNLDSSRTCTKNGLPKPSEPRFAKDLYKKWPAQTLRTPFRQGHVQKMHCPRP